MSEPDSDMTRGSGGRHTRFSTTPAAADDACGATPRNQGGATSGPRRRRGFTLLEMLTVVAFLVIVMGLMISLARYVRATSADRLTRRVLRDVEALVERYVAQTGRVPLAVSPKVGMAGTLDEAALAAAAKANNQALLRQLRTLFDARPANPTEAATPLDPATIFSPAGDLAAEVNDAWGSPLLYMTGQHPQIGMAPGNRPFCFSAGPDRRYLTRGDNLYSYEDRDSGTSTK